MELHHTPFTYAKSVRGAKTPDFLIELEGKPIILEVGGRGKGRSQFKGLSYDQKTVLTHSDARLDVTPSRVPLFLLGFPA
ncbi:MAG TPA: hypothetical protein PKK12_06090 [Candidatus Aminicenantes bacterium]|nr:hypothetical protein [Candidatus Aminicenantes bacterium]